MGVLSCQLCCWQLDGHYKTTPHRPYSYTYNQQSPDYKWCFQLIRVNKNQSHSDSDTNAWFLLALLFYSSDLFKTQDSS